MAEFCRECFVNKLLSSEEQQRYKEGRLKIVLSKELDLCEGCGDIKQVVVNYSDEGDD